MSILFTPLYLGQVQIKNRFVFSACEDCSATDSGKISEPIIHRSQKLSRGGIGLMISSHMAVHPLGRTRKRQLGIYSDDMLPGLKQLAATMHQNDGKIVFQLGHAGIQTTTDTIGQAPLSPSGDNAIDGEHIQQIIESFVSAGQRAAEAGADGVQIHAAHGYLINQFLSPYYNRRQDSWGGSDENRFRILNDIVSGIKKILPENMILLVKLNAHDHTPKQGIVPSLAAKYAKWLAALGINGLEVSCGTSLLSPWNMCMGDVPVQELLQRYPESQRSNMQAVFNKMKGKYDLIEGYNLEAAKLIRPVTGKLALLSVGGWREVAAMEQAINSGFVDFISMCRPFIREPHLVRDIERGKTAKAGCTSCNKCLAALSNNLPVKCYVNGF